MQCKKESCNILLWEYFSDHIAADPSTERNDTYIQHTVQAYHERLGVGPLWPTALQPALCHTDTTTQVGSLAWVMICIMVKMWIGSLILTFHTLYYNVWLSLYIFQNKLYTFNCL